MNYTVYVLGAGSLGIVEKLNIHGIYADSPENAIARAMQYMTDNNLHHYDTRSVEAVRQSENLTHDVPNGWWRDVETS